MPPCMDVLLSGFLHFKLRKKIYCNSSNYYCYWYFIVIVFIDSQTTRHRVTLSCLSSGCYSYQRIVDLFFTLHQKMLLLCFQVGDICCAPFEFDSHWYRARILEMNEDGTVELYYVDFGDSGQISKDKLREIRCVSNVKCEFMSHF